MAVSMYIHIHVDCIYMYVYIYMYIYIYTRISLTSKILVYTRDHVVFIIQVALGKMVFLGSNLEI